MSKETIIDTITNKINCLGISSSRTIGYDEFNKKRYSENDIVYEQIEGSGIRGLYYPYNDISYNPFINKWIMKCCHIHFRLTNNLIPNQSKYKETYHTLPEYLKIQRSNNTIQNARLKHNNGIFLRESHSNPNLPKTFYITLEYDESDYRDITKVSKNIPLEFSKECRLEDILKLNTI